MHSSVSKPQAAAWAIWAIASIFYAYQYILRVMPNIMIHDIMDQFGINAATFGQFSGVYYLGYALLHLPVGIMLDRFGPRRVMTGCILCTVIGIMPLLFASHWFYPIAGRFLIGFGSSAAILGVFKIIRMTFSEARFPRMLSYSVTIGLAGGIFGGGPVNYLREVCGYHEVIELIALSGLLLAAFTYWMVPEQKTAPSKSVSSDVKEVLRNRRFLFTCIFAGFMVGPLEGFADVWGAVFFKEVYGFQNAQAASLPSLMYVGMCFGAPVLSWIGDKTKNYNATIMGAGAVMTFAFIALLVWQMPAVFLSVLFVFVGVSCSYQILAIYKASTYVREEVSGIATACANMIIMTFGHPFHATIGAIVNGMGGPDSSFALIAGVSVIPAALFVGATGFWFLEKSNKKIAQTTQA